MNMKLGKINSIEPQDNAFTSVLANIHQPPKKLYIAGKLPENRPLTVAIVGTRKPSHYGKEVAYRLAYDLAKSGIYVISGLALGTDTVAHKAALDAGGVTIAVVANGLHRIYPASHEAVAEEIIQSGGAIISEYPYGEEARNYYFLARNRLISGLCDAVIIVEATERSGTLSTFNHAMEQNKEIFAVPGPVTSLLSVGPNRLLQQGAYVVTSAKDVLNIIAPDLAANKKAVPVSMSFAEATIIELLNQGVRSGDDLLQASGLEAREFLQTLTTLEVNGLIRPLGGDTWIIC